MGVLWALTSGSGVAVALLQGSAGPLIGVAISASLLPPVVNCVSRKWWTFWKTFEFILNNFWSSFRDSFGKFIAHFIEDNFNFLSHAFTTRKRALACIWLIYDDIKIPHLKGEAYTGNSSYVPIYTNYIPTEFLINGIVSALLTVVNVICIFITAIIVLKIKEVAAPYTSSPDLRRYENFSSTWWCTERFAFVFCMMNISWRW